MTYYWIEPRRWIFEKGYQFLSFAKYIGKNINKNISDKYCQKLFDHANQSTTDAPKTTSKKGN